MQRLCFRGVVQPAGDVAQTTFKHGFDAVQPVFKCGTDRHLLIDRAEQFIKPRLKCIVALIRVLPVCEIGNQCVQFCFDPMGRGRIHAGDGSCGTFQGFGQLVRAPKHHGAVFKCGRKFDLREIARLGQREDGIDRYVVFNNMGCDASLQKSLNMFLKGVLHRRLILSRILKAFGRQGD